MTELTQEEIEKFVVDFYASRGVEYTGEVQFTFNNEIHKVSLQNSEPEKPIDISLMGGTDEQFLVYLGNELNNREMYRMSYRKIVKVSQPSEIFVVDYTIPKRNPTK